MRRWRRWAKAVRKRKLTKTMGNAGTQSSDR
jgi:hypothetical protein